jgi:hypothetical protein
MKFISNLILFLKCVMMKNFVLFDKEQAFINVWLSGASYCPRESFENMVLSGPASGFIYKDTLYDHKTDLQGFTGILPSTKTIHVAFRGSSSYQNWMKDFEVKKVDYTTFFSGCENCKIHYGFYTSVQNIKNQTLDSIKELKKDFPNHEIILTGHSYGAAVSQIMALECLREGIEVQVYNYGQPRIGNIEYAKFVNLNLKHYWRFTHDRDMVPHLPPVEGFGYEHSTGEVFEDINHVLTFCSRKIGEDPSCANQYKLRQTIVDDHYYYLNHRVQCLESTNTSTIYF